MVSEDVQALLLKLERDPSLRQGIDTVLEEWWDMPSGGLLHHSSSKNGSLEYLALLRAEIHNLLCTKSTKYASERKNLGRIGFAFAGALATGLTTSYGVPAGLASSIALVALFIPLKCGTNAWCKLYRDSPTVVTHTELELLKKHVEKP